MAHETRGRPLLGMAGPAEGGVELPELRRRLAAAVGHAARRLWRRPDKEEVDDVVLDLLVEALHRMGRALRPRDGEPARAALAAAPAHIQALVARLEPVAARPAASRAAADGGVAEAAAAARPQEIGAPSTPQHSSVAAVRCRSRSPAKGLRPGGISENPDDEEQSAEGKQGQVRCGPCNVKDMPGVAAAGVEAAACGSGSVDVEMLEFAGADVEAEARGSGNVKGFQLVAGKAPGAHTAAQAAVARKSAVFCRVEKHMERPQCPAICCPSGHVMGELSIDSDEMLVCDTCSEVCTDERALYCGECDFGRCGFCVLKARWPGAFPWHLGCSSDEVLDAVLLELGFPKRSRRLAEAPA